MSQNMSEALQKQGFAFYTQELECISDVIAQKKRMEQFCWSFTNENWTYPDCEETSRTYIFCTALPETRSVRWSWCSAASRPIPKSG